MNARKFFDKNASEFFDKFVEMRLAKKGFFATRKEDRHTLSTTLTASVWKQRLPMILPMRLQEFDVFFDNSNMT